jgi:D-3-phosphoglycerate dehydrogenase
MDPVRKLAQEIAQSKAVLFLGRHVGYPVALEGALKLKELAYMHAEGFAAGELKHGPIALIEDGLPVVVVTPSPVSDPLLHSKLLSNIREIQARGARTIVIAEEGDETVAPFADFLVELPVVPKLYQPLLTTIPLQVLAAEIVSLHRALTPQTRHCLAQAELEQLRPGTVLINVARGGLVNEADLAKALQRGHVAAAAIDVFTEEPPKNSPLLGLQNVVLTPHTGGSTAEAQEAVGVQIAQQVKEYLKHGVIQNAVNVPSVSAEEYAAMQPYIVLAERIGAFLAQVSEGSLEEISIRYSGHIAEWKTELIRNGAIKGIMNQALEEKANLVNAATIAQERGLRVLESHKGKTSTGGAGSVLSIFLKTATEEHMVKGAVLHGEAPRLLHVDGIDVEAPLERNLIYMRNRDVPGVIGKVGTILGEESINIADFSLGRRTLEKESEREAIAVVHVDGQVSDEVLKRLRAIPAVQQAKAVRLF